MNYRPVYLDTSALAKLVFPEPESAALAEWLASWPDRLSSRLAEVEMHRLLRRGQASARRRARAQVVLSSVTLLRVDEPVLDLAGQIQDRWLRTLDAVHLASALTIGDAPEAFVTYDGRLAKAATRARLQVVAPAPAKTPGATGNR